MLYFVAKLLSLQFYYNSEKLSEYECGFEAFDNSTRQPFDVHFYLVGILFVLFDVEIAMLFPWVINYFYLSTKAYITGIFFVLIIIYGVIYEWKKGSLDWE